MRKLFLVGALLLLATQANAVAYDVDNQKSSVEFSGNHAGQAFNGKFGEWAAIIDFDPKKLEGSSLKASFKTAKISTGNKMYDGTLPQEDWFDSEKFPTADFVSESIKSNGGNNYTATGTLTIRGISKPAKVIFATTDLAKNPVIVDGALVVNRLEYQIGAKSDPRAEWVSADIGVKLHIVATPAAKPETLQ